MENIPDVLTKKKSKTKNPYKKLHNNFVDPTRIIKVPESLFREAKEINLHKELSFYYLLKTINKQGFLSLGSLREEISKKWYDISSNTVWTKLKQLLELKWIEKHESGYSLVSYDRLWEYFGYNINPDTCSSGRRKYQGFKIFKIPTEKLIRKGQFIKNFKVLVAYEETKSNLQKQCYAIRKKIDKEEGIFQAIPNRVHKKISINNPHTFELVKESLIAMELIPKNDPSNHFYEAALSCQKVAELMGYESKSEGYKLEQEMKRLKLIRIKRRRYIINRDRSKSKAIYSSLKKDNPNLILSKVRNYLVYYDSNQIILKH